MGDSYPPRSLPRKVELQNRVSIGQSSTHHRQVDEIVVLLKGALTLPCQKVLSVALARLTEVFDAVSFSR